MTRLAKNPAALTFSSGAGKLCRAAGGASLAALALALAPLSASAAPAAQSAIAPGNPAANVVPVPNYNDCSASGLCGEGQPCYTANYAG